MNRVFDNMGANMWYQFFRYWWILEQMPPNCSVIDVGCGFSIPARLYYKSRMGLKWYIGMDANIHRVDFGDITSLGNSLKLGRKPVMYVRMNLATRPFPLPDNSVDIVVNTEFLEHIPGDCAARVVEETYRVLKPGGRFVMTTPAAEGCGRVETKRNHIHNWYMHEMDDLLERSDIQ